MLLRYYRRSGHSFDILLSGQSSCRPKECIMFVLRVTERNKDEAILSILLTFLRENGYWIISYRALYEESSHVDKLNIFELNRIGLYIPRITHNPQPAPSTINNLQLHYQACSQIHCFWEVMDIMHLLYNFSEFQAQMLLIQFPTHYKTENTTYFSIQFFISLYNLPIHQTLTRIDIFLLGFIRRCQGVVHFIFCIGESCKRYHEFMFSLISP